MKPEPYHAPPSRPLTADEHLMLRVSVVGGLHPFRPVGRTQWATARRLVKLGLGEVEDSKFVATPRGAAVVRETGS